MNTPDCNRRTFLSAAAIFGAELTMATPASATPPKPAEPKKTILVIGAHHDDPYGAAGLMVKAIKAGHRVVIVQACGDYSNWPPVQGRVKDIREGAEAAAQMIGAELIFLDYKIHEVPVDLAIKRRIAEISDQVKPDIAVLMAETDHWTDHTNIARAAKDGILFAHGYLAKVVKKPAYLLQFAAGPNQTYKFKPDTFVDIGDVVEEVAQVLGRTDLAEHGDSKCTAELGLYDSTGKITKRIPLSIHAELRLAQCRCWGGMCGVRFAEAFQLIQDRTCSLW